MAVADRLDLQLAGAEAVLVEERGQRVEHDERRARVAVGLRQGGDDVVGRDGVHGAHGGPEP